MDFPETFMTDVAEAADLAAAEVLAEDVALRSALADPATSGSASFGYAFANRMLG